MILATTSVGNTLFRWSMGIDADQGPRSPNDSGPRQIWSPGMGEYRGMRLFTLSLVLLHYGPVCIAITTTGSL